MRDKFLDYLQYEKRYSPHTIISYGRDLDDFILFHLKTEASDNIIQADKKIIRNFIVDLNEKGVSKRTVNRKLSTLRSFYLFLLRLGEIDVSPLETINSLKFYAEKQIPVSQEEMEILNSKVFPEIENLLEECIVETLYQTGMRKAELCGLKFEDVDLYKNELKILGKGNKERYVPISEKIGSLLKS